MTNYERFKEEIIMTLANDESLAVMNGKPGYCGEIPCERCDLRSEKLYICGKTKLAWLNAEYIEKLKLTQREWHLCKAAEHGWIARDKSGKLYYFDQRPSKRKIIWHTGNFETMLEMILPDGFAFIKWEDTEPWSIEELLKLEVEG